jgi:CBS domain containing-hemolysin-like protein
MSEHAEKPWLSRITGRLRRRPHESVRDRMEELIERPTDTTPADAPELDLAERALLTNVLKLRGITAVDVMIPRADIVALRDHLTLDEALAEIQR